MVAYTYEPNNTRQVGDLSIQSFITSNDANMDAGTVASFGSEWNKFDTFSQEEVEHIGKEYFDVVDPEDLQGAEVLDAGCGSGRWSRYLSSRVAHVEAIDPSDAIFSAAANHRHISNIRFTQAGIDRLPFPEAAFDLVICLGVLHHVPDTQKALQRLHFHLKPGGKLLLYLYYDLEGRSAVYKGIFNLSTLVRRFVSSRSLSGKKIYSDLLAVAVYLPLVLFARFWGLFLPSRAARLPLAYYTDKSFRIMRNDALDRFGTPLEKRFSRAEITAMLTACGFTDIVFSQQKPYWHCIATKLRQ